LIVLVRLGLLLFAGLALLGLLLQLLFHIFHAPLQSLKLILASMVLLLELFDVQFHVVSVNSSFFPGFLRLLEAVPQVFIIGLESLILALKLDLCALKLIHS